MKLDIYSIFKTFSIKYNNRQIAAIERLLDSYIKESSSEIKKDIEDNELAIASALNDLNARIQSLQESLTEISERVSQLENT